MLCTTSAALITHHFININHLFRHGQHAACNINVLQSYCMCKPEPPWSANTQSYDWALTAQLIARVFLTYITYTFPYRLWTFGIKFFANCWNNSLRLLIYITYSLPVMLITFAVTVFSVLWLFQSHAAVVKRYNAFCAKLTANSGTEQNNISKSTFPVYVSEHFHI